MSGRERGAKLFESSRGFIVIWILTVSLLGGVAYPAAVAAWYNNLGNTNADWVHHMFIRKEAALRLAGEGPRILTVGGSGCLFSLDAETMQRELGTAVINLCSHAGVGLEYMLARARRHARPGDTVILAPEYRSLTNPDPRRTKMEWDYFTTWDRRHYLEHGLPEAYRMLYGIPFGDLWKSREGWRKWREGYKDKLHEIYDVALMTPNGDLHESLGNRPVLAGNLAVAFVPPAEMSRQLIQAFAEWAHKRGVRVVAVYQPAALDPPDYWRKTEYFAMLPGWWKSLGIETLGTPEAAVWQSAAFMDTMQHAGPGVSYAHAIQVAHALRKTAPQKELMLLPAHPPQALLPLPHRPGAAAKVYFGTDEEDRQIAEWRQSGGRVFAATRSLADQMRSRGFQITEVTSEFSTPAAVLESHSAEVVAACVRPGAPAVSGLPAIPAGQAWVGVWRNGQWRSLAGPAAASFEDSFTSPLATGEPIQYRFTLRSGAAGCRMEFQRKDRAQAPTADMRLLVVDTGRGILRGIYNFDATLRAESQWVGEITAR